MFVVFQAKESWSMSDVEKLEQSEILKKRGGELFKVRAFVETRWKRQTFLPVSFRMVTIDLRVRNTALSLIIFSQPTSRKTKTRRKRKN